MTFSSNCCVRYNPKDSLVILIRNNALTKYRIISHDLAKKHINISLVQPAKMLPKSSYNLAQDYSLTLPRILTAQCMLIDVEAQGEMFPGCGQARRISWEMARHCGKHWQLSAQNVTGLFKFKNRGEGRGWGGRRKKDFIYVETNIREEVFDVLVLGQVPILSVYLSEMTSLNVRE